MEVARSWKGMGRGAVKEIKPERFASNYWGTGSNSASVKSYRSVGNPKEREIIIRAKGINGGRSMRSPGGDCRRKLGYREAGLVGRILG